MRLTAIGIVFAFVFCLIGDIPALSVPEIAQTPLERLNIRRSELKQMCDSKGKTLYDDIQNNHISFTLNLTEKFANWKRTANSTDDVNAMVQERCKTDTVLMDMLTKLVESSQLCMEEKDRLSRYKLQVLITRLMELFCAQNTYRNAHSADEKCLNLITNAAIDSCKEKYKTDQLIPLPFVYSVKECSDYQKYSECRLEAMKDCKDATKNATIIADAITFHTFYGCPNSSLSMERVVKRSPVMENNDILRFNIIIDQLKESCRGDVNRISELLETSQATNFAVSRSLLKAILHTITDTGTEGNSFFPDSDTKVALEKNLDAMQLCLKEEDRFDEEGKQRVVAQRLETMRSMINHSVRLLHTYKECFRNHSMLLKFSMCNLLTLPLDILDNLPLTFAYTAKGCSDLYESQNCKLNIIKDCATSTKLDFQSRFNKARKFVGCNEMITDADLNNSDASESSFVPLG